MANKTELWKTIPQFPDYAVSNMGRVKRLTFYRSTKVGKVLKPNVVRGYLHVSVNGRGYAPPIHVLVARAFIPNPLNLPQVNHKDLDKKNCTVDNLEWVTAQQNHQHALAYGLWSKPHKTGKRVYQNPNTGNWVVIIQGKNYGTYKTKIEAESVRDVVLAQKAEKNG
jgi:hypothetical protein